METERKAIDVLISIETLLKKLVKQSAGENGGAVASDRDLDGTHGNPILKFLPRDWNGDAIYKGSPFSECPPDLLDLVASTFDYFADKAEENDEKTTSGKPVAPYKRADAARARGWAKRIRTGRYIQTREPAAVGGWAGGDL